MRWTSAVIATSLACRRSEGRKLFPPTLRIIFAAHHRKTRLIRRTRSYSVSGRRYVGRKIVFPSPIRSFACHGRWLIYPKYAGKFSGVGQIHRLISPHQACLGLPIRQLRIIIGVSNLLNDRGCFDRNGRRVRCGGTLGIAIAITTFVNGVVCKPRKLF